VAFDAFLTIKGIPGESGDAAHKDCIEVIGYSLTMTAPIDIATGAASGRRQYSPLSIQKAVDKSSVLLAKALTTNQKIDEVTLELDRATGTKAKFMEYKLSKVHVSAIHAIKTPQDGGGLPLEEVSFSFATIMWTYFTTDKDGKAKGSLVHEDEWGFNK
jgi:type VI secretion system secreted protein Hcp